ncbi:MAG: FAD-dependent oxidoreductase [Planctomycetota bacterium]
MSVSRDGVVVVGAGVVGLASAHALAARGYRVTVIDRSPERRDGCSFGNAGMIVPSHFVPLAAPGMVWLGLTWMFDPESPFWIRPRLDRDLFAWGWRFLRASNRRQVARAEPLLRDLNLASRRCYEELADETRGIGDFGLVKRGLLMLCRTERGLEEEAHFAARANALGVPAEVLDAGQTAAADPGITMAVAGSVRFPLDAHLAPERFLAKLTAACRRLGVVFRWGTEVSRIRVTGRRIAAVESADAFDEADHVVLAGGAWSPGLVRSLGLRLPMQAGKGYSLTLERPPQLPSLCSICTEARLAVTPMDGRLRIGGTMEIAGLDERVDPRRVRGIIRSALAYFPGLREADFAGVEPWKGLRPCSPDGLPYLGRTARFDNLVIATGHAMMGLSLAPITGKLVGQLVAGERPDHDLALLSPDRYG